MKDQELRDQARELFTKEFTEKFNKGIREHNPDGDKGLWRMSKEQLVRAILEEVYDLFAYTFTLGLKILAASAANDMKSNKENINK